MHSASSLMMYLWPLLSLMIGALQVTAAIVLLRERGMAPWMMLIGSVIGVVSGVGSSVFAVVLSRQVPTGVGSILMAMSAFAWGGHLLFSIGLLLYALQRRLLAGKGRRIGSHHRLTPPSLRHSSTHGAAERVRRAHGKSMK